MSENTFTSLLEKKVADVERPVPLPPGSYDALVKSFDFGEARNEKKTPYVKFTYNILSPREDVDADAFEECGGMARLSRAAINDSFYITEDALFRLREFLEIKLGLEDEVAEMSLKEAISEAINRSVVVQLIHAPSKNPEDPPYVNVGKYLSMEEAS
jgi:hypothetical protein